MISMGALSTYIYFTMAGRSFYLVHGGLSAINRFVYASTPAVEKQQELALCDADVVIGGHAGIPFGEVLHGRYWLNSGVIGMPANDGTRDGWYLLLLPQAKGVRCEWRRLSYDTEAAHAAMQLSGRSDGYATAFSKFNGPNRFTVSSSDISFTNSDPTNPSALIEMFSQYSCERGTRNIQSLVSNRL